MVILDEHPRQPDCEEPAMHSQPEMSTSANFFMMDWNVNVVLSLVCHTPPVNTMPVKLLLLKA